MLRPLPVLQTLEKTSDSEESSCTLCLTNFCTFQLSRRCYFILHCVCKKNIRMFGSGVVLYDMNDGFHPEVTKLLVNAQMPLLKNTLLELELEGTVIMILQSVVHNIVESIAMAIALPWMTAWPCCSGTSFNCFVVRTHAGSRRNSSNWDTLTPSLLSFCCCHWWWWFIIKVLQPLTLANSKR